MESKEGDAKYTGDFSSFTVRPKFTADAVLPAFNVSDPPIKRTEKIVVVGASTGGTRAIADFLSMVPENAPAIVIVQHMPEGFTNDFARHLNIKCAIKVKEAEDGDKLEGGTAYIAPGNKHTIVRRAEGYYYAKVIDGQFVCRQRPSADVLFRSAARFAGRNAIGVIMTGMGDDGARGMLEMHKAGSYTIAQDETSCVIYGMPKQAVAMGGVDEIVPLEKIAKAIMAHAN